MNSLIRSSCMYNNGLINQTRFLFLGVSLFQYVCTFTFFLNPSVFNVFPPQKMYIFFIYLLLRWMTTLRGRV